MLFEYFQHIFFKHPYFFGLLVLLPFLVYSYVYAQKRHNTAIRVSTLADKGLGSMRASMRHLPFILRMLALVCIIFALARPQVRHQSEYAEGEGIDIVLCIDVSGSMTARDFHPNRLEAAKQVAMDFVRSRPTDRIGVVIFSGESFTLCPITTDHAVLLSAISGIRNGLLEDGTAIGSGLSTSVDRLRESDARSRIVLLLTDGINNGGLIDPITAKEIAKTYQIKVYTIGVGSDGYAPQPVNTPAGVMIQQEKVNIDEKLMTAIATETGGKYFRARDNESLNQIYATIDKLEKSKVEIVRTLHYEEKFYPFAWMALALILLEGFLRFLVFRKFP